LCGSKRTRNPQCPCNIMHVGLLMWSTAKLKVITTDLPRISSYNTCLTQRQRQATGLVEISDTWATFNFNFIGFYPTTPPKERERKREIERSSYPHKQQQIAHSRLFTVMAFPHLYIQTWFNACMHPWLEITYITMI
jgi:hypothetical protein